MTRLDRLVNVLWLWLIRVPVAVSLPTLVFLYEFYVVPDSDQVEIPTSTPEVAAGIVGFAGAFMLFGLAERTGIEKAYTLVWSYIHQIAASGRQRMPRIVTLSMLKLLHEIEDKTSVVVGLILASPLLAPGFLAWHLLLPWLGRHVWKPLFRQSVPAFWLVLNSRVYSSLDPMEPSIRLLQLHPGKYDDPIMCHLKVANVYEAEFEAVSCARGGHLVLRRTISINGRSFFVTENLIKALRYLRRTDGTRVLWIDQMCINPLDKAEKTNQVTHKMHLVYSNAARVIAWLGIGSPDISWAFQRAMKYPRRQFEDTGDEPMYPPPRTTPLEAGFAEFLLSKFMFYPISWVSARNPFDYNRPYCYVGQAVISDLMYTSPEDISEHILTGDITLEHIWLR